MEVTKHRLVQFSPVQSLSRVRLFGTPWIAAHQASLSITNSWSLLRLASIESVIPSSHLILCHPLLLLPSILPSIRVFSSESTLNICWDFPGGAHGKEPMCQGKRPKRCRLDPWVGKMPWRRQWQPTPVSLPGESHGQRSLVSNSPSMGLQRVGYDWIDLACTHTASDH